jgi:hypothetical protein
MTMVVDDLNLLAKLSGDAGESLRAAVESSEIFTTGAWYLRLHRAINDPKSSGVFTRIVAELSLDRRSELIDSLNDLPPCRLPVRWDQLIAGFASDMGPPSLPVMGPL